MTKKVKKEPEYYATKLRPILQVAMRIAQNNPRTLEDFDYMWANLVANIPELADKKNCPCCNRSMKITIYEADLLDALLILKMAEQVRTNMAQGMTFTEANKVHLPTLKASQGILKRQTKCDYLGLVKQQPNWKGSGYWLLTTWAWKAIRGQGISRAVKYWEGTLIERSVREVTLKEMFEKHKDLISAAVEKRKAIKADYRADFKDYNPMEWSDFMDEPNSSF